MLLHKFVTCDKVKLVMKKILINKGFTFVELLVVIGVITILASIAVPSVMKYYKNYKYGDYIYSMENLVRLARMTAMERSNNIGLCVDSTNKTLTIVNMGVARTGICIGQVLQTLRIEHDFVSISGSGAAFDPRGFAIFTGNVCITDGEKFYRTVISRFGAIRIEKGNGGCPS
jgi:type IV fimbrial biogenesis protein FimT